MIDFINYKHGNGEILPYERYTLYNWITELEPNIVLEVGTGSGASSYVIMNALATEAKLYTCDPVKRGQVSLVESEFENCVYSECTSDTLIDQLINSNIIPDFIFFDGPDVPEISLNDFKRIESLVKVGCFFSAHDWEVSERLYDGHVCNKNAYLRPYIEASNDWVCIDILSGLEINSDYHITNDADSVGLCLYKKIENE